MKSLLIISFLLFLLPRAVEAQAPVFSQYYATGLYLNPALAGLEKDTYLGINYRSQWSNLSLPFATFQFSFIQPITKQGSRKKHLGGFGLSYFNDVAGANKEFTTRGVSLAIAHNFHLTKYGNNIISTAIQIGATQQQINYNSLQWSSQYSSFTGFDQTLPGETGIANDKIFRPVVNIGAMWYYTDKQRNLSHYSTSIYNGVSISNLIPATGFFLNSKSASSILYKINGGFTSTWSRKIELSPNYIIQLQDNNFQINLGAYIGYSIISPRGVSKTGNTKIIAGAWYRLNDAFVVSTGLTNNLWNVGFSYDSNIFALSKTFGYGNAFEFSLAHRLPTKNGFKRFSSPLI
ncbi:hypothetical protein BH10BAC4_BH10BAC4_09150 [soil metagenome]